MPKTISFWDHPIATLEKALHIRKQIEALRATLSEIYGDGTQPLAKESASAGAKVDGRKGKRSAATIAKMKAAQKARWAAKKGGAPAAKVTKTKRVVSKASRAKMAAAQRARRTKEKIAPELSMPDKLIW